MRELLNESVDLIIADPNYGVSKYKNDVLDLEWLKEAYRILKVTGSIYIFGSVWWYPFVHVEAIKLGFIPRNVLVWFYENAMARQTKNYQMQYDPIGYFTKSDTYTFNLDEVREPYKSTERLKNPIKKAGKVWIPHPNGRKRGNVIDIPALCGANYKGERTSHPTQKPETLIKLLIIASSNKFDVVLDPFLGSGTTLAVCTQLNRHGIGYEINQEYELIIKKRLKVDIPSLETWAEKEAEPRLSKTGGGL